MYLRRLLFTMLIILGTIPVISAKEDNPGGFGIKGGIGLSTISFGNPKQVDNVTFKDNNNKWKVGGLLGVSYEKRFGKTFGMDIEALIANKGVKRDFNYDLLGKQGKVIMTGNLFTVDIPVSAKFYLGNNFNFNVGPYFSYIFGGRSKIKSTYDGKTQDKQSNDWYGDSYKDMDGNLPLNRFDFGINAGIEFVTNSGFGIGARVQKGFIDLTNDKYKGTFSEGDGLIFPSDKKFVTNTGFQIYGIVRF
ncbi:MAG: PorT family protein [Chitinophagales bacterium]|nr:PorT family protein [Chitinophagales bacterium]